MSNITEKQAISLAVSYNSYNQAIYLNDASGVRTWGNSLLDIQKETGIKLHSTFGINSVLELFKKE